MLNTVCDAPRARARYIRIIYISVSISTSKCVEACASRARFYLYTRANLCPGTARRAEKVRAAAIKVKVKEDEDEDTRGLMPGGRGDYLTEFYTVSTFFFFFICCLPRFRVPRVNSKPHLSLLIPRAHGVHHTQLSCYNRPL